MHSQCDAQSLAIDAGQPAQELLVDADGQWQAVTEDREGLLQFLQELAGVVAGTGLAVAVVMSSGAEKGKAALSSGPAERPDLQCAGVPAIRSLPGVPPGGQK
jgi:hypothetical protein